MKREHDEQVERDSAHAPGVAVAHRVAIDLGRMQVQKHVREHAQRAIARRVVVLVAEDRSVDLGLGRIFQAFDLLFGLRGHIGLERLDVFLDAGLYPVPAGRPASRSFPFPFSSGIVILFSISCRGRVLSTRPGRAKLDQFSKSAETTPDR